MMVYHHSGPVSIPGLKRLCSRGSSLHRLDWDSSSWQVGKKTCLWTNVKEVTAHPSLANVGHVAMPTSRAAVPHAPWRGTGNLNAPLQRLPHLGECLPLGHPRLSKVSNLQRELFPFTYKHDSREPPCHTMERVLCLLPGSLEIPRCLYFLGCDLSHLIISCFFTFKAMACFWADAATNTVASEKRVAPGRLRRAH